MTCLLFVLTLLSCLVVLYIKYFSVIHKTFGYTPSVVYCLYFNMCDLVWFSYLVSASSFLPKIIQIQEDRKSVV